jgi:hypothetical protein
MKPWGMLSGGDPSRIAEIAAASVFLVGAAVGYIAVPQLVSGWAFAMPGTTDAALAPTFFPRLAMVLLALASLGVLLSVPARTDTIPLLEMSAEDWRRVATVLGLVLLFFVGLQIVGFIAAAGLFIAATSMLLGYGRPAVVAAVAIAAPLLIAFSFRYGLRVLLPESILL